MKKKILGACIIFLLFVQTAWALPLWEISPFVIDGYTYTVTDRSNLTDVYHEDYFGYRSGDYSGYYIGTISGNTDNASYYPLQTIIKYYYNMLNDSLFDIHKIYKVDNIKKTSPELSGTDGQLTVTWNSDLKSGGWFFDDDSGLGFGFYAVKGGPEFALYYVHPTEQEGTWTTRHLLNRGEKIPGISHFSGAPTDYDPNDPGPNPPSVPEPTTLLLLGAGLLGLGFVGRRRLGR